MFLGKSNSTGGLAYSQSGWYQGAGNAACYFGEYDPDGAGAGTSFTRTLSCSGFTFGQQILYTTQFNTGCSCEQNIAGLIVVNQTPFNPLQLWANLGNQWNSETHWDQTFVPGNASNPATFQILQVQQPFSSAFVPNTAPLSLPSTPHPGAYTGPIYLNSFVSYQT
jgi:hypothetical protein